MRTYIKGEAARCLGKDFYPEHVCKAFVKKTNLVNARTWVKKMNNYHTLMRYIDCSDVVFFGNEENIRKNKRHYLKTCDITSKQLDCFNELNHLLLLDIYEKTTDEQLKKHYKLQIYLSGHYNSYTYIVTERQKMVEWFHKDQAKLIKKFASAPPAKEDLRNFILIAILFSKGTLLHDEKTREQFLQLCRLVS